MTAMKDDFYHGGLTDDEVSKSRRKVRSQSVNAPQASLPMEVIS